MQVTFPWKNRIEENTTRSLWQFHANQQFAMSSRKLERPIRNLTIDLCFTFSGRQGGASFLQKSQSEFKQNQCNKPLSRSGCVEFYGYKVLCLTLKSTFDGEFVQTNKSFVSRGMKKECCVLKVHLGLLSNLNWQLLYAVSSSNKSSSSCIIFLTLARRYATLPVRPCAIDSCIKVSSARVLRNEKCNKSKEWGMDGVLSKTETTRKLQSKTDETIIAV